MLASNADAVVTLELTATANGEDRPLRVLLDDIPLGTWTVPAAPGSRTVVLHLAVPAGQHTLAVESSPAPPGSDGRALSLSFTDVTVRSVQRLP